MNETPRHNALRCPKCNRLVSNRGYPDSDHVLPTHHANEDPDNPGWADVRESQRDACPGVGTIGIPVV